MQKKGRTTTPQIETLRRSQEKKESAADPVEVLDRAIYHLWETINDLEEIQPERVEHFRVSIFGSSRIRRGDPVYDEVKKLSYQLAHAGIDIVTGGGPGLMEAANAGAVEGQIDSKARSFGLPIHMPSEEQMNPFVDRVFRHRTFFSRLHHFVRLSSAFVVFSGGIGTCLEAFMVWQLLQVRHMKAHPFILVGDMWPGLRSWMKETMGKRGLVGPNDLDLVTMVDAADDAIPVILAAYDEFRKEKYSNDQRAAGTRRPARRKVSRP